MGYRTERIETTHWITTREAAEVSGYSLQYVWRLIRQGKIHADKRGGRDYWVDSASLVAYTDAMTNLGNKRFNASCVEAALEELSAGGG